MLAGIKRKRQEGLQKPTLELENDEQESGLSDDNDLSDQEDEEEEWNGAEGQVKASTDEAKNGTVKKPPTGEELRAIKDAADLYRSNSFKLQIDALLPNVRPKSARIPPLDRFLLTLHSFLNTLPSISPQHPLEAARSLLKKGIAVPYPLPLPTEDTNWKVSFEKPTDITLVGSWANKISVKPKDDKPFGVDLAVEMPESLFQEKDYLNGRFFHKRAFYLASIAAAIGRKKGGLEVDTFYESVGNDSRLTTLVLRPRKDDSANDFSKLNAQVRIIPVLPTPSPIPIHRLSPSHSNIRISTPTPSTSNSHTATPIYNSALLLAITPKRTLLQTHSLQQICPSFSDALTLLRIWANQRGYGAGARMCVKGFEGMGAWWIGVLGLLILGEETGSGKGKGRKPVGKGVSSYQLFRAALDFLARHDFEKAPVFVKTKDGHQFQPEEYDTRHEAVFVDSSSTVNLLAGVPLASLEMLRYDANKTLQVLDRPSVTQDSFTEVFLKDQRDAPPRFDTIIRVDLSSAKPRISDIHSTLDYGSQANSALAQMASIIRRGLGDRIQAIAFLHPSSEARPISQAHPVNPSVIHIGLVHDPEHAYRLVDHGPAADDPDPTQAERFREFWGEKSELRRFKDGRIVESVVWDVKTSDERAHIPSLVVRYLLARHFGVGQEEDAVQTWQPHFDAILRLPESVARLYRQDPGPGVSSTGFRGALEAFDRLVKQLKALDDDLPLGLVNLSPSSEYLRYTSVFGPTPLPSSSAISMPECCQYRPTMDIILEFEKSGRWPDDLRAIQKIKLALMERMAGALMASVQNLKATVVIGDGLQQSEIVDQSCLEIVTADGWAFSARVWHDREATLLDRIINDKPKSMKPVDDNPHERHEAQAAREIYTRRFIHAPRHHRAIASLCHKFVAYAGTVRLVKRWFASHWLLYGHVSEEVVEIICAAFFLGSRNQLDDRHSVPGTKERGFAAVVEFLKDWRWEDGLTVPLYGDDNNGDLPSATRFHLAKVGVWAISTELDKSGHMWTSHGPDLIAAHRVRMIAKATWDCLTAMETGDLNVKGLFVHPTNDYDFVIELNPTPLPRYHQSVVADPAVWAHKGKYANLRKQETSHSRLGMDPAQLLFDDLSRVYINSLKFFYDPFGGDRIGAVWEPSVRQDRPFRVLAGFSSAPSQKDDAKGKAKNGLVTLNETAVLSEIRRMASGLLEGFTMQS